MFRYLPLGILAERVVYIALLCVGIYFIYQGNVWQKYQQSKTNFAVYTEPIVELPTITTWMESSIGVNLKFERDYSIVYCNPVHICTSEHQQEIHPWALTALKEGANNVSVGWRKHANQWSLKVRQHRKLILTPMMNYNRRGDPSYTHFGLIYKLKEKVGNKSLASIGVSLSTQNNTHWGLPSINWRYDGAVTQIFVNPGEQKELVVLPEKYIFNPDIEKCRNKPYAHLLHQEIVEIMLRRECKVCKPKPWTWNSGTDVDIPSCNGTEQKCFTKSKHRAIYREVLKKPCTQLQYNIVKSTQKTGEGLEARVLIKFPDPPRVQVREEYVIYDLISMVGAIGGTLGLFIGFSFVQIAHQIIRVLKNGISGLKYSYSQEKPTSMAVKPCSTND